MKRLQIVLLTFLSLLVILQLVGINDPLSRGLQRVLELAARRGVGNSSSVQSTDGNELAKPQINQCNLHVVKVQMRDINPYRREVAVGINGVKGAEGGVLVLNEDGSLAGSIKKIQGGVAWVQLVSDPGYRLPVLIDKTQGLAILKGQVTYLSVDRIAAEGNLSGRRVETAGIDRPTVAGIQVGLLERELTDDSANVLRQFSLQSPSREEYASAFWMCVPNIERAQ